MRNFALGLAAVCACHAAFAAGQPPMPRETLPFVRLATHPVAFAEYSGLSDSVHAVVRDSAAWRALWDRINAPFFPRPVLPAVDFQREMIVVAAMGRQPSGGYDIVIDGATEDSSGIEISVKRTVPGERCLMSAAVTDPVDLARIPASGKPVRFRERELSVPCGGRVP
jgi:hypothetical protein